jgi:hypothetical protein
MNTKIKLMLTATIVTLFGSSCRSKVIMYDQANGRYVEGKPAKELLSQQEKVLKAREQARDREHERNLERRDASRYVTRESVLFGQSVDEFDVLAARERALQAEADVARTQAQNAESVSRAHKIIDYEKRYERAMGKLDKLEVLPGVIKD